MRSNDLMVLEFEEKKKKKKSVEIQLANDIDDISYALGMLVENEQWIDARRRLRSLKGLVTKLSLRLQQR